MMMDFNSYLRVRDLRPLVSALLSLGLDKSLSLPITTRSLSQSPNSNLNSSTVTVIQLDRDRTCISTKQEMWSTMLLL
jgi:hypothetical protein